MKKEGEDPAETLVNLCQTTRRHIQEDRIFLRKTRSLSSSDCHTKIYFFNFLCHHFAARIAGLQLHNQVLTRSNVALCCISKISPSRDTVLQNDERAFAHDI